MEPKAGTLVAVRHYSVINPFMSVIKDYNSGTVTLQLTKDFSEKNLLEGDPIVLGYENSSDLCLWGCDIEKIDIQAAAVFLKIDKENIVPNIRRHERFPISLYADLITPDSRKKHLIILKNLSLFGMLIYAKEDFVLSQPFEIDIYTENDVVFIKGVIVRKTEGLNYHCYGLEIKYENAKSLNLVESYLKKLKISYEQQVRKMNIKT